MYNFIKPFFLSIFRIWPSYSLIKLPNIYPLFWRFWPQFFSMELKSTKKIIKLTRFYEKYSTFLFLVVLVITKSTTTLVFHNVFMFLPGGCKSERLMINRCFFSFRILIMPKNPSSLIQWAESKPHIFHGQITCFGW